MRPVRHLTPRCVTDRVLERMYRWTHRDDPWLTRAANRTLAGYLRPSHVGLEFGAGRSTVWFARRVQHLTSVEHQALWHAKVTARLQAAGLENVALYLRAKGPAPLGEGRNSPYVAVVEEVGPEALDFVLVDGAHRDFCARAALSRIRPGGVLIIDDVHRYLPCRSRAPRSRRGADGAATDVWRDVDRRLHEWRHIWTSDGVSDTALFFKPYGEDQSGDRGE